MRFTRGNERPIRFDDRQSSENGMTTERQLTEKFRHALATGDADSIHQAITTITAAMKGSNQSLFRFRCFYNDLTNIITAELRKRGENIEAAADLFQLSQCLSVDELDLLLRKSCEKLIGAERSNAVQQDIPAPIRTAAEMIDRQFADANISVASVAETVGMTDSRLSVAFKKAYQTTPQDYITGKRMDLACRMLTTTQLPIKDIAVECGYYDISGFNRRFKACIGQTPQQYRQQKSDSTMSTRTTDNK